MTQHYVNNKQLYEALVEYKKAKQQVDDLRVPEYIGECILLITQKLASRGNFNNYSYKDEMVSDGIENCLAAVDNYDPSKFNNPFGYFSRIAWYAFIRRIDREKRQNYLKYKNYRKHMAEEELLNMSKNINYYPGSPTDDVMDEVIRSYEESIRKKKESKREKERQGIDKFIKGKT